ncbi:hypothetical protein QM012_003740 [Aureobasidium pullulans]|uniref:Uncharacterized protein n=1 Tax=Aureobasidium pullulans TaxID=5580 RepID=A0ABR0T7Z8_AURPU
MTDGNPSAPGTDSVAAESEVPPSSTADFRFLTDATQPCIAQMVQAIEDKYNEIEQLGHDSDPCLYAWQNAAYHLAELKRGLKTEHTGELDAQDMDLGHVVALARIFQADKDESELLSEIHRCIRLLTEMIDELELLVVKLKVKARASDDTGAQNFAQETEDRAKACREVTKNASEQIIKQREEIMDGR